MSEERGVSVEYRRASPWPLFVALGLALLEGGILFGSPPVSLGGGVLLAGSVVGILRESGYAATLWVPAAVMAAIYAALGSAVYVFTEATLRGSYLLGTAAVVAAAAAGLYLYETERL